MWFSRTLTKPEYSSNKVWGGGMPHMSQQNKARSGILCSKRKLRIYSFATKPMVW